MLGEMGIPVYSERGPHGGFSLVRGFKIPPLVFTPEEAVAVYLGTSLVEAMWGRLYREAAHGALAKLDNVLPDEQRHEVAWARRALIATGMQRADLEKLTPYLETLRRALREGRRVSMTYHSRGRPAHAREVDVYALVHRWGWWYAVGHCHLRQDVRSFRIDRITALTVLDATFQVPPGFDVHSHLAAEFQNQPQIVARLRFAPEMAGPALESPANWQSCEEQADGSVMVTLAAPDLRWAASTALAYGPLVEVLEPGELRRMVAEWAQAIAMNYADG
jgi:predicted DNA-binding transcriptional regulator YafY